MLLIVSLLFLSLIITVIGQYGQPFVGAVGEFTFECKQVDLDVISPRNNEYEVIAGKSFSYKCEFFVDTRNCEHNPQSTGCAGIEIAWNVPDKLKELHFKKGITRKIENSNIERNNGYDLYLNWFNLTNVGLIHNGDYNWKFNLNFEMRTVFEGSFRITAIGWFGSDKKCLLFDMLMQNEPCRYDDTCQSAKCEDGACVSPEPKKFPWLLVGLVIGVAVVLISLTVWVTLFVKTKQKLINRRFH